MSDRPGGPGPSSPGLLSLLVAHLGQGKLPARDVVAALRAVVGVSGEPPTRRALLEALSERTEPEAVALTTFLRSLRFRDAQRVHEMQAAGQLVPADLRAELAGFRLDVPAAGAPSPEAAVVEDAGALLEIALPARDPAAAEARASVQRALDAEAVRARAAVGGLARGEATAARGIDPRVMAVAAATAFGAQTTRAEQQALLDTVLASPVDVVADVLPGLCQEPWAQERAALALTIRFGTPYASDWAAWTAWFAIAKTAFRAPVRSPSPGVAAKRLLAWVLGQPSPDPVAVAELELRSARSPGVPPPPPPPVPASPLPAAPTPQSVTPTSPTPAATPKPAPQRPPAPRPPPPPPPEPPSPWREHVQGFLSENAYMVAGIVMVVVGASLLAYFTWDKHWLLRYTIMPGLLFVFTAALGRAAGWLEARDASLRDTGATLRGAAVLLLPVNFMALALLAGDAEVTHKAIALPAMSLVYLGLAGGMLFGWCGGVDPRLVPFLPLALLVVDALVLLRPAAAHAASGTVLLLVGFHVGFLVVAGAVVRFTRRVLDAAIASERRVPVFVGVTLALTYLEAFVLVHGPAAHRPPLHAYAALPVLAGGLVLFVERRFLAFRGGRVGSESFLGYALVLLGILMGGGDPQMRIATLVLAGIVWLLQAGERGEPLQHWIGVVLLVLGGASVGLLPDFPGPHRPILGVVLGLLVGLAGAAAGDLREGQLRAACRGVQPTVLVLSTAMAVLAQWHYRSDPHTTAATILVIAGLLAFLAWRDQSLPLVHTVAVHFALVLPYLGFVDMGQRTLRGNTLPFGFALLSWGWIALVAARPARLLREARSTVLFLYGALALTAMALRVLVEGRLPAPASLAVAYPEHLGPLLMAGALVCATWWTRSLVPAAMASVLLVILFPALKANLQASFPALGWGTGFGSALSALALVLASFRLREAPSLRDLEGGDLLFGQAPFPFRRFDHTLFTGPLLASALFLIVRVDTFTLVGHLDLVPLKTAAALVFTAAAWMLLAAYWRERSFSPLLVHPGWVALSLGIWFGYERVVVGDSHKQWPIALALLVMQVLELSFHHLVAARRPWAETVLAAPLRGVCRLAGLLLSFGLILGLVAGAPLDDARVVVVVVGLQLARTAVGAPSMGAGASLVGLAYVVLLAAAAPGRAPLADRLGVDAGLTETLVFVIVVQLLQALLEHAGSAYTAIRPILRPAQALSTGLALALGVFGIVDGMTGPTLSALQQGLLLLGTALVARANSSGLFSLIATGLLYLFAQRPALALLAGSARSDYLCDPLRLSVWALGLAVIAVLGRRLEARVPPLLTGRDPLPLLAGPVQPWLHATAVLVSLVAAGRHTVVEELRHSTRELLAPWLGAATTIVVGWFSGPYLLYWVAVGLTSLGNVHAVRLLWGEPLRGGGVSEVHLVVLGLGFTLLEGTVLRRLWRDDGVQAFVNRASLAVAGLILTLLTTNYAAHPDLAAMSSVRFLVSGVMALGAGLYFRRAARHPGPGEEAHVDLCEGLYHFGLAVAAWCAALLVPWFRQPPTVLLALGVPALGFWMRAELESGETGRRFRSSAAVLGFLLLGLYALRPVFQMVLFPRAAIETDHYHYYAGLAIAVGVLLLRLHGLGGTSWLAFYGGLALITGSYFALTAWPTLSPFADDRIPAAWCAVGLAHFWTLASAWRSPLRGFLQEVAGLDEAAWLGLRASWGRFVLLASQVIVFLGLIDAVDGNTYAAAPLLLGAASVFIHHAVLYASAWRWQAGLLLVALALHADFVVPSTLQRDDVVWALLVVWAGVLFVPGWLRRPLGNSVLGVGATVLAALVFVQVLYHHACSQAGLWAVAAGAVLAALTPRDRHAPVVLEEKLASALLLAVPTWLVYFWTAPLLEDSLAVFDTRAVLLTAAALYLTGLFARGPAARWERALASRVPRLLSQAVALASRNGSVLHVDTMLVATGAALALQVMHYDQPLDRVDVLLFLLLYAGLAVSWYREGERRRASPAFFVAEACLVFAFAVVRRQLMLTAAGWTYEHDIWASLGVSLLLAGTKQVLDDREAELRAPFLVSVLGLPALALVWTLVHHLGVDLALLVVGLHSLMFAYLGRDRADSPYNLVATSGFVAFVLMVFWTKLELRVLHAYVIPVGLGVLVLLQLFGRDLPPETRNRIRLVTLLAMLGSAGYYALVDDRHPVPFNLTLLALCLAAMALGSFLRIRLYVVLGLAGVLVDLASIVTKVLVRLDRGERMTSVGVLVLVLGGALVSGAIYYKTHRDLIDDWLTGWRRRVGAWE